MEDCEIQISKFIKDNRNGLFYLSDLNSSHTWLDKFDHEYGSSFSHGNPKYIESITPVIRSILDNEKPHRFIYDRKGSLVQIVPVKNPLVGLRLNLDLVENLGEIPYGKMTASMKLKPSIPGLDFLSVIYLFTTEERIVCEKTLTFWHDKTYDNIHIFRLIPKEDVDEVLDALCIEVLSK